MHLASVRKPFWLMIVFPAMLRLFDELAKFDQDNVLQEVRKVIEGS